MDNSIVTLHTSIVFYLFTSEILNCKIRARARIPPGLGFRVVGVLLCWFVGLFRFMVVGMLWDTIRGKEMANSIDALVSGTR